MTDDATGRDAGLPTRATTRPGGAPGGVPQAVVVACFPRSGSTVLGRVLGEIPGFFFAGELQFLFRDRSWGRLCGCGRQLRECPLWSAVVADLVGRVRAAGWAGLAGRGDHEVLSRVAAAVTTVVDRGADGAAALPAGPVLDLLFASLVEVTGGAVVVDTSKRLGYLDAVTGAPGARRRALVHLVRDPRGAVCSRVRSARRRGERHPRAALVRWRAALVARDAVAWTRRNRHIARLTAATGAPQPAVVDYGRLTEDPAVALAALLDRFPGAALPLRGDTSIRLGPSHGIAGNRNRFEHGLVELRPDLRWQRELSRTERSLIRLIAGRTHRRLVAGRREAGA